jgi:hypothetical protein
LATQPKLHSIAGFLYKALYDLALEGFLKGGLTLVLSTFHLFENFNLSNRRAGDMAVSVRQVIAVLAVVVKRDWLDQPDQQQVFFQVAATRHDSRVPLMTLLSLFDGLVFTISAWHLSNNCT